MQDSQRKVSHLRSGPRHSYSCCSCTAEDNSDAREIRIIIVTSWHPPYRTYQLYVLWSCSWEPSFNLSCRSLASRLVGQAHALHLTYSSSLVVGHSPPHGSNKPFGCKSCSSSVCSCTCSTPVYKSSCLLMCCHPVLGSSVVAPNSCLG